MQSGKSLIPIFFTFDCQFVLAAGVALHSLLKHASTEFQYHLYVVHTSLKPKHEARLQRIVDRFPNAEISFINASQYSVPWDELHNKSHFSKEIFFKLTAAEMFPQYDRILFSDVDVIFMDDISSAFFAFPDDDFYYAGTRPIQENTNLPRYTGKFSPEEIQTISDYEISAGFMLLNLKKLRADNQQKRLTEFFWQNAFRLILPEQDCIALCLAPKLRFLDYKYVVCAAQYFNQPDTLRYNPNNVVLQDSAEASRLYRKMLAEVVQLHYPGAGKPWNTRGCPKREEWLEACREAGLFGYYEQLQPAFFFHKLKRYSLLRFLKKHISKA